MASCLVAECEVMARWLRVYIFYTLAFFLTLFLPVAVWCAMTKAAFVFYRVWKCITERSDGLRPTFANARRIAKVTWSERYFTERQVERARAEVSKALTEAEGVRNRVRDDMKQLPRLGQRKQVFFVERHREIPPSSSSSGGSSAVSSSTNSARVSSIGVTTSC